jgi:hypothetical protein
MIATAFGWALMAWVGKDLANKSSKNLNSWAAVWKQGFVISLALSGLVFIAAGAPSCVDQDPRGCIELANDGEDLVLTEKAQRALKTLGLSTSAGTAGMLWLMRSRRRQLPIFPTQGDQP